MSTPGSQAASQQAFEEMTKNIDDQIAKVQADLKNGSISQLQFLVEITRISSEATKKMAEGFDKFGPGLGEEMKQLGAKNSSAEEIFGAVMGEVAEGPVEATAKLTGAALAASGKALGEISEISDALSKAESHFRNGEIGEAMGAIGSIPGLGVDIIGSAVEAVGGMTGVVIGEAIEMLLEVAREVGELPLRTVGLDYTTLVTDTVTSHNPPAGVPYDPDAGVAPGHGEQPEPYGSADAGVGSGAGTTDAPYPPQVPEPQVRQQNA